MCGIFAYLNYLTPCKREHVLDILIEGLKKLEYRGYDSAGLSIDNADGKSTCILKTKGRINNLCALISSGCPQEGIEEDSLILGLQDGLSLKDNCNLPQIALAHTRWATHGPPKPINAHPQRSDPQNEFIVIHNGIITNFKELKKFLQTNMNPMDAKFESETDTEAIAKLTKYVFEQHKDKNMTFRQIIEKVSEYLEGAFAIVIKSSTFYPGECVATKRGSPLLIGIKANPISDERGGKRTGNLCTADHVPVFYSQGLRDNRGRMERLFSDTRINETDLYNPSRYMRDVPLSVLPSSTQIDKSNGQNNGGSSTSGTDPPSTNNLEVDPNTSHHNQNPVEFFISSDGSTILEHTNRVIYLEDDDVASISNMGHLSIHRIRHPEKDLPPLEGKSEIRDFASSIKEAKRRQIDQLQSTIEEIMLGDYSSFMQKEIFEQAESVVNTMRGRVDYINHSVVLGGIKDYVPEIRRCRRIILIGCGTSYNATVATRQIMEELTELPVIIERASDFLDRRPPIYRDDICFFVSQTGETGDTLNALRYCHSARARIVGVTNTVGSSLSKESDCGIHINAGPEIGVASTKAYTSQFISLVMFALVMSDDSYKKVERRREIIEGLDMLQENIQKVLEQNSKIEAIASEYFSGTNSLLIMGRGYNYATCLEGALKLKELVNMHSEAILAGELKNGPIGLVDGGTPILTVISNDATYQKCTNALKQIISRGCRSFLICDENDTELQNLVGNEYSITVPHTVDCLQGILNVIPLQLLAYHIAKNRGLSVDAQGTEGNDQDNDAILNSPEK